MPIANRLVDLIGRGITRVGGEIAKATPLIEQGLTHRCGRSTCIPVLPMDRRRVDRSDPNPVARRSTIPDIPDERDGLTVFPEVPTAVWVMHPSIDVSRYSLSPSRVFVK